MQHKWNLYVNEGERRIPSLVDHGNIDLPCSNPEADSYRRQYDPTPLWAMLQNEGDLSQVGLYISLYCTEIPTYDGKRWFLNVAYNTTSSGSMRQEATREVSWVNTKGIQLWNTSLRDFARIHQARGIVDYTLYVSRSFGYCFLLGMTLNDDDEEDMVDFAKFYPSIHHYHQQVAINEVETYQPFNDGFDWYPKNYNGDSNEEPGIEGSSVEGVVVDEAASIGEGLAQAVERVTSTMRSWGDAVDGDGLEGLLDLGEDILEEEGEGELGQDEREED